MSNLGFFDTLEVQASYDQALNGILDSIFESVSDTIDYFQDIPENAILAFKRQVIQKLQPEIDRVRQETLADLKKDIIAQLPSMRALIEQKSPELIAALQKQIALEVVRSSIPWISVGTPTVITPGDEGLVAEKDLISQTPMLIPNKEIEINELKFGNPHLIAQDLLTPDVIDAIQQNVSIPMRQSLRTHLVVPIGKKLAITSIASFGLGVVVTVAGYSIYNVIKQNKQRARR